MAVQTSDHGLSVEELLRGPALFAAWLRQTPARRFCAAHRADSCPLATFLREVGCYERVVVGPEAVATDRYDVLPPWARTFVRAWDMVGLLIPPRYKTARVAAAVLRYRCGRARRLHH